MNAVVMTGVLFAMVGSVMSFPTHPHVGNDQRSLGAAAAWVPNALMPSLLASYS